MKITKHFLKEIFAETVKEFNQQVFKIPNEVELSFVTKEEFLEGVKQNSLIQQQIMLGIYKDIEKEYPNFLVVYQTDKHPLMKMFGLPYKVTLCDEMAKDKLKPFSKDAVISYLKRSFAHELTHIVEDVLIKEKPQLWEKCLKLTNHNEQLAQEYFSEEIADRFGNKKSYQVVFDTLWRLVNQRVKNFENNKNILNGTESRIRTDT